MGDIFDAEPLGDPADTGTTENRAYWASQSPDGVCAEFSDPHQHTNGTYGFDVYWWDESGQMVDRDDGWLIDE
ncbi:hypothetical protein [Haloferax sp. YSSS75]|uniref:hypothetical protein n=1 Tax=Haloferax sp. YSSS75 TaxID=3388564 RepID=UPI00398CD3E9